MEKNSIYATFSCMLKRLLFIFLLCASSLAASERITLSMVMRNEGDRYLRRVLEAAREYITDAVIIDDASTDNSVEVCREVLKGIPLVLIQNSESKFSNEVTLRRQQWEATIATNPDWILNLDADEIFEERFASEVKNLVRNESVDVYCFPLYDFWDEEHYRDDPYWFGHHSSFAFLVRYRPGLEYSWKDKAQHCGRFPVMRGDVRYARSDLRLKHYGWAKLEDRISKYERYMRLDPEGKFGCMAQYQTILDPEPNLIKWEERPGSHTADL